MTRRHLPLRFSMGLLVACLGGFGLVACATPIDTPPPANHTITFHANGGTGTTASVTIAEGASAKLTANGFSKSGSTFGGWATSPTAAAGWADGASYTMGTADVTLYAVWTTASSVTHTITFHANGGTGTTASVTIAEGASAKLTTNGFSKSGSTFGGWATSPTAAAGWADGASYTMGTADVTLYAVWSSVSGETSFSLVSGQTGTGYLTLGATHQWTFTAQMGNFITVSAGDPSSSSLDPSIVVLAPDGTVLGSDYGSLGCTVAKTATNTGTYTIRVSDSGMNASGTYTLSVIVSGGGLTISSGDEGGPIASGATGTGTITNGDTDGWTFTAKAGDFISVSAGDPTSSTLDPSIALIAPDGSALGFDYGSLGCTVTKTATVTGTYTVTVTDSGQNGSGTYTLSVIVSGGGLTISSGDEGGPIASGATGTGTITNGDTDGWTFTAHAGDFIAVSAGDPTSSTLDPSIALIAPDGSVLGFDYGSLGCTVTKTATVTGTYTVTVTDSGQNGSGTYTLSVIVSGGGLTISSGDEGGPIAPGSSVPGTIGYGDTDGWTFTATAGSTIVVSASDPTSSALDPSIALIAPNGVVLGSDYGSLGCTVTKTATVTGTYTVTVTDSGQNGTGTYTLSVVVR